MTRGWIIFVGAIIIIASVGGVGWYAYNQANAARPLVSEADLAAVRRGDLVATVNATGAIEPITQTTLAFTNVGNVVEINVKQGDTVKKGQVLARLDTRELELQVTQAEANLAASQARVNQLKRGATDEDIAAAKQNLASAQAAYDKLVHPDQNDVTALKSDIDKAKAALDQAQAAYDRVGGSSNPNIGLLPQSLQLQSATLDYQKALALYNSKLNPGNAQLQQALAAIKTAEGQLAKLQPAAEDLAAAQANADAARAGRDLAAERLKNASLVAPMDGTLTRLDLDLGSFVAAGRVVATLADVGKLRVTINIDETDIPRVQVGLPVDLDLDAFPDQKITGKVAEISPGATTVQGVVNYSVKVLIDPTPLPLKLGMTTNANVQVAKKANVLLVPNRAIRATGNRRIVSVYDGKGVGEVNVTLGLSNDQESEVLSGLKEGDRVFVAAVPAGLPGFGGTTR